MSLNCPFITSAYPDPVDPSQSILVPIDCIGALCHLWSTEDSECSIKVTKLILRHIHNAHEHERVHTCAEGFTLTCGNPMSGTIPKANILVTEFVGNEDMEGNSLIYGKDFKIDPTDPDIPLMLKSLENHPDNIATVTMTWQEYLDSL